MAKAKTVSAPKKVAAKAPAVKQSKVSGKRGQFLQPPPAPDKVKIGSLNKGQF
jgi:hypothetical protein